jgi:hypothetical protein
MAKPSQIKPKPKSTPKSKLTAEAAIKEFQKQISPRGVATAEAEARRALEKKYPGMFVPETRTAPVTKRR